LSNGYLASLITDWFCDLLTENLHM